MLYVRAHVDVEERRTAMARVMRKTKPSRIWAGPAELRGKANTGTVGHGVGEQSTKRESGATEVPPPKNEEK